MRALLILWVHVLVLVLISLHVVDLLGGLVAKLTRLVEGLLPHPDGLVLGSHVDGLLGRLEGRRRLQPLLGERNHDHPLAGAVGREGQGAERHRHALLANAEEASHADDGSGDAARLVEKHVVDVADIFSGLVRHSLADELTCRPLACGLNGHKLDVGAGTRGRLRKTSRRRDDQSRGQRGKSYHFHVFAFGCRDAAKRPEQDPFV